MILFYSDYCGHCRMLIETIKSYDKDQKLIKPVSIDVLRSKGKSIPVNIKSVPTLYIPLNKEYKVGKQVFDYLLLPGSGILLKPLNIKQKDENEKSEMKSDLVSFSFASSNGFSDNYSLIEDNDNNYGFNENSYAWSHLNGAGDNIIVNNIGSEMLPIQEETRKQRDLLDIDQLRIQREMDLKENDLNRIELPLAKNTRE